MLKFAGAFSKMKLLSVAVFVVSCSVTLAFPDANNPGVATGTFSEQWSGSQKENVQNTYLQNRPEFQPVNAPIDRQNAIANTRGTSNTGNQYSSIKYNHPLPPSNVHQPINNIQKSSFSNNNGGITSPSQALALHPTLPNYVLKEIYSALKPTKLYTIIYPNGTIEHTDDLHSVAARHPNYVLVKADELLSKNNPSTANGVQIKISNNQYVRTTAPLSSTTTAQSNQNPASTSTTNQMSYANQQHVSNSQGHNPTNSPGSQRNVNIQVPASATQPMKNTTPSLQKFQESNNLSNTNYNSATSKTIASSVPTEMPFVFPIRPLRQYEVTEVEENLRGDAVASNPSAVPYQSTSQTGVQQISSLQNVFEVQNAVAANPLPIYPTKAQPEVTTDTSYASPAAVAADAKSATLLRQYPILDLKNSDQDIILNPPIIKNIDEAILAPNTVTDGTTSNLQTPVKQNNQTNSESVPNETVPVLLPEVLPQVPVNEIETPTPITTDDADTSKSDVTTIYEANESNSANIAPSPESVLKPNINTIIDFNSSNDTSYETVGLTQTNTNTFYVNNSNTSETVKEFGGSSTVDNSSTELNTLTASNGVNYTMFNITDDSLWDIIRNNSQNVYFFFMPSQPKISRETKKTIFPNGTTVEEITEIVTEIGQDGEPIVSKTTSVVKS